MSTINAANLELQLVQKINSTTNELELLALSVALRQLQNGAVFVVQNFADLPPATANAGSLYFVVSDARVYVAYTVGGWQLISTDSENTLWTWGNNNIGELGTGTSVNRSSPGTTAGCGTTWCGFSSGCQQSAAIKTDGTLWTWGANTCGRLGDNTVTTRSSPVTTAGGGANWRQVSAQGFRHMSAIKTDGSLWTWGCNTYGQLGNSSTTSRSSPGTTAGGGSTWCQTSAGNNHTTAVKTDGTLWTWGLNSYGNLGTNNIVSRSSPGTTSGAGSTWCMAAGGVCHSVAVKTDGTLWTWGLNSSGQLGTGGTVNRSSPGTTAGCGTTWCTVTAGCAISAAIKTDGTLWTWGLNTCGRLGDGTTITRNSPVSTVGGTNSWCQVSTSTLGGNHTTAMKSDGTLWTWGLNSSGQLGTGTTVGRSSPGTTVAGGTTWCTTSSGSLHTMGIQSIVF